MIIFWFRQDLRLSDNPGLFEAAKKGAVFPIYILDRREKLGGAERWWLHHSLKNLDKSLGGKLGIYSGDPETILLEIAKKNKIEGIYWNRCYTPYQITRDSKIKQAIKALQIPCLTFNSSLLWEPMSIAKSDGSSYKIYTPFSRACLQAESPRSLLPPPPNLRLVDKQSELDINSLLPIEKWVDNCALDWDVGEDAAEKKLKIFVREKVSGYKKNRDYPGIEGTSHLSPHLHFGEISPHQIWHSFKQKKDDDTTCFLSELIWREFSYYQLYNFPDLPKKNFQEKFNHFPWEMDKKKLKAWQEGKTGYPIVDAGMRELMQTGYMHNRVRMIVASFLVKNLLIHWEEGAAWFLDYLVDGDLASNSANWQWVAGCGADAAPYFRVFNPVLQGEKFDSEGLYTRHFVPELASLDKKYLFKPWEAPEEVLKKAGITLGTTYPKPIVDQALSRTKALEAYGAMNEQFYRDQES